MLTVFPILGAILALVSDDAGGRGSITQPNVDDVVDFITKKSLLAPDEICREGNQLFLSLESATYGPRGVPESLWKRIEEHTMACPGCLRAALESAPDSIDVRVRKILDFLTSRRVELPPFDPARQGSPEPFLRLLEEDPMRLILFFSMTGVDDENAALTCLVQQLAARPEGLPARGYVWRF